MEPSTAGVVLLPGGSGTELPVVVYRFSVLFVPSQTGGCSLKISATKLAGTIKVPLPYESTTVLPLLSLQNSGSACSDTAMPLFIAFTLSLRTESTSELLSTILASCVTSSQTMLAPNFWHKARRGIIERPSLI